ncbi:MAG TPA: ASCH domain-containing protein [Polyangiaceae bacterium]|nr:ASCH domain-containing protein [Polyangiaceae bacterium]
MAGRTVLLFQKAFHAGLKSGAITLTYRRWPTARVKTGGRYRCHPIGVLEVDRIERVKVKDITAEDAVRAGFDAREALVQYLAGGPAGSLNEDTELFRVELHYGGDGDRVPLALEAELSPEDVKTLETKLAKLDADNPWTLETLRTIEQHPQVAARILAKKLGRERDPFKVDVRKLKHLGLTQSFEVGYELSPRGKAFLKALETPSRR